LIVILSKPLLRSEGSGRAARPVASGDWAYSRVRLASLPNWPTNLRPFRS